MDYNHQHQVFIDNIIQVLKPEEEALIVEVAKESLLMGVGLNYETLGNLIQECLIGLAEVNPERSISKWSNNRPTKDFVRYFAERHDLVYRRTMGMTAARGQPSKERVMMWFADSCNRFKSDPVFEVPVNI